MLKFIKNRHREIQRRKCNFCLIITSPCGDVLESCSIKGADDSTISDAVPNDINRILAKADIRAIFTTGKKGDGSVPEALSARYGTSFHLSAVHKSGQLQELYL